MRISKNLNTWCVWRVWLRYFYLFKKDLLYAITTTFVEPILLLLSLGFGLGSLIGFIHAEGIDISYRQFVFTGLVAQSLLFQGFFQSAYGSYFRIYYQRIFHTIAITPITLTEVVAGELLWDATQALFAGMAVLLIGTVVGDFNVWGALLCIPLCFFSAFIFSGVGLLISGLAKSINQIAYPQFLFVIPMFLFCGVFFPIEQMPESLQIIAWALPLTSVISLIRTLTLDFPFQWQAIPLTLVWIVGTVFLAKRTIIRRLIN